MQSGSESPTASEALNGGNSFMSTWSDKDSSRRLGGKVAQRQEHRRAGLLDHAADGSGEEIALTSELFTQFDRNGDGKLTWGECVPMMRAMGAATSEGEAMAAFKDLDINGDSAVSFQELSRFVQMISKPMSKDDELMEAFKFFAPEPQMTDSRSVKFAGGGITKQSLAAAFASVGEHVSEEECASMIAGTSGGQEALDFDTFRNLCKPVRQARTGGGSRVGSKTTVF
eukprot:CAMPEP_0178402992 /NCGR_PEP_ID=MMETSP0689_2-20121128/17138_1 /TAXON_ID=160604 /ORGANISM="Amphidinium massartii, Strain CS-259" /LENGTH=227 /DNA_ID=CAMNT_0020023931 /DNA_START=160 /DNA_END=843 /DNA_ORIENTATION=-